jgi:hypothetical protein
MEKRVTTCRDFEGDAANQMMEENPWRLGVNSFPRLELINLSHLGQRQADTNS